VYEPQTFRLLTGLFDKAVENVTETFPSALRKKNRITVVSFDLRDGHVASLLVSLYIEIEILVLDP